MEKIIFFESYIKNGQLDEIGENTTVILLNELSKLDPECKYLSHKLKFEKSIIKKVNYLLGINTN